MSRGAKHYFTDEEIAAVTDEEMNDALVELVEEVSRALERAIKSEEEYLDDQAPWTEDPDWVFDAIDQGLEKQLFDDEEARALSILNGPVDQAHSEVRRARAQGALAGRDLSFLTEKNLRRLRRAWEQAARAKVRNGDFSAGVERFTPEQASRNVVVHRYDSEEFFGYEGREISVSLPENTVKALSALYEKEGTFVPSEETSAVIDDAGFRLDEVLGWIPSRYNEDYTVRYGFEIYEIAPETIYPGGEGYLYLIFHERNVENFVLWEILEDLDWIGDELNVDEDVAERWQEFLRSGKVPGIAPDEPPQEELVMTLESNQGTFDFWDLKNHSALKKIGNELGICIGQRRYGYPAAVEEGKARIFVMKTKKGRAKIVIETDIDEDGNPIRLKEIRGKANRAPGFLPAKPDDRLDSGRFRPVEVEMLLAFAEELGLGDQVESNRFLQPGIKRLSGDDKRLSVARKNPGRQRRRAIPRKGFQGYRWEG